jgi:hypothetical protein
MKGRHQFRITAAEIKFMSQNAKSVWIINEHSGRTEEINSSH